MKRSWPAHVSAKAPSPERGRLFMFGPHAVEDPAGTRRRSVFSGSPMRPSLRAVVCAPRSVTR